MKKSKLQDLIRETIDEILNEETTAIVTTKTGTKSIPFKDEKELDPLKKDSNVSSIETTGGKKLKEMARGPIKYKLSNDYANKISELPYVDSDKRMKWVNGIISYITDNGASDATTIAREKFNAPQPRIADYVRDMIRLGILTPEQEGVVPQFMRPDDEEGGNEPAGVEDMFVGDKENPLSMYFDDEESSTEEEPDITPEPSNVSAASMSDEDYEAFMQYTDLESRLAKLKSDILKIKRSRNTPSDLADQPSNEVERLNVLKNRLQQKMSDLLSNSEYLRKRQAKMTGKPIEEPKTDDEETLEEWMKGKMQYYAGIKK